MQSTQEKFMAAMRALADEFELDLVVDTNYANTGTVMFQPADAFKPLVKFAFSFQHGYASFDGFPDFGQSNEYRDAAGARRRRGHYVAAEAMDDTIAFIRAEIATSIQSVGGR